MRGNTCLVKLYELYYYYMDKAIITIGYVIVDLLLLRNSHANISLCCLKVDPIVRLFIEQLGIVKPEVFYD